LNTTQSLYNGSLSAANSNGSIFGNNIEIVGYSGEINYFLNKKWSVSIGYSSAFSEKVIYSAPALSCGIALKL